MSITKSERIPLKVYLYRRFCRVSCIPRMIAGKHRYCIVFSPYDAIVYYLYIIISKRRACQRA